jgi:chaperonin cofactor prefoldin
MKFYISQTSTPIQNTAPSTRQITDNPIFMILIGAVIGTICTQTANHLLTKKREQDKYIKEVTEKNMENKFTAVLLDIRENMATKSEIKEIRENMATKDDLKPIYLKLGIIEHSVESLDNRVESLDNRVESLEKNSLNRFDVITKALFDWKKNN